VLRKLERAGYIKRLKMKKSDIEKMETGMRHILTRGVERIYFEITDEGIAAVEKALHFSSCIHFNKVMRALHGEVRDIIGDIIRPLGVEITFGVVSSPTKQGIHRSVEMLPEMEDGELIFLLMGSKKDLEVDLSSEFAVDLTTFPCKFDDIPLKSNYLDAAVSFIHLHDVSNPAKLMKEVVRTVKPGGQFILVDFSKLSSMVLEDIFNHNVDINRDTDYRGVDVDEIFDVMDDLVVKVHVERVKELFIIHGRKKKKRIKKGPRDL
jgi:hypothetical protein